MSAPALIRKQDMLRAAEVAKTTGCRVEIRVGDALVSIIPGSGGAEVGSVPVKEDGIDYSRPSL